MNLIQYMNLSNRSLHTDPVSLQKNSPSLCLGGITLVLMIHGLVAWAILHATNVNSAVMTDKNVFTVALVSAATSATAEQAKPETSLLTQASLQAADTPGQSTIMPPEPDILPEPDTQLHNNTPTVSSPVQQPSAQPATDTIIESRHRKRPTSSKVASSNSQTESDPPGPIVQKASPGMVAKATDYNAADTRERVLQAGHHCPKPEYPKISRRLLEQGVVTLRFLLGQDGQVLQTEIAKTSGYDRLDIAARTALARCQFRRHAIGNQYEPDWAVIHYSWQLK